MSAYIKIRKTGVPIRMISNCWHEYLQTWSARSVILLGSVFSGLSWRGEETVRFSLKDGPGSPHTQSRDQKASLTAIVESFRTCCIPFIAVMVTGSQTCCCVCRQSTSHIVYWLPFVQIALLVRHESSEWRKWDLETGLNKLYRSGVTSTCIFTIT